LKTNLRKGAGAEHKNDVFGLIEKYNLVLNYLNLCFQEIICSLKSYKFNSTEKIRARFQSRELLAVGGELML